MQTGQDRQQANMRATGPERSSQDEQNLDLFYERTSFLRQTSEVQLRSVIRFELLSLSLALLSVTPAIACIIC